MKKQYYFHSHVGRRIIFPGKVFPDLAGTVRGCMQMKISLPSRPLPPSALKKIYSLWSWQGEQNLEKITTSDVLKLCKDVSDISVLNEVIKDCDLVVGALPGFMGYETMKRVIKAKKNIVDISFYPEDPFGLDKLAKENNVIAVMDCGVAPGMGNVIFGYHDRSMKISDYECLVGGLPVKREWPYEYQAVFSPIDVIEEYIRPARYIQNKKLIIKEALSETELIEFEEIGTLESWNSDGAWVL